MTTQPDNPQENVELLIRKMRLLWLGSLVSLAVFCGFIYFMAPPRGDAEPNDTLFLVFVAVGLSAMLVSFVVKKRFFAKAEEQQQVELVQQGFIVAVAIAEVASVLGVIDYFVTGDRFYYVLFLISACGQLLHYPRREPFLHATFKTSTF